MDVLSGMFNHDLNSNILFGVPLGYHGRMCHLLYADDLIILSTGGEGGRGGDLRIIKLIIFVFEGISGLPTNPLKTCLYTTRMDLYPEPVFSQMLIWLSSSNVFRISHFL